MGDPLTIGALAARTGLPTSTLRYYDRIGLIPATSRSGGQRRYDPKMIERVRAVTLCQRSGFSLEEIGRLLDGGRPWQALARQKVEELQARIAELEQTTALLRSALECGCRSLETCGRTVHLATLAGQAGPRGAPGARGETTSQAKGRRVVDVAAALGGTLAPRGSVAVAALLAAQEKAGKTWAALDLAVSVATGQPWLDHFACPSPGPVLLFLGEGGERATVRRIEAIATAKGVDPGQLAERLRLCFRVPRLAAPGAGSELAAIQAELAEHPAALVVLDPLYLAAAGASGANLYDMGAVLQAIQGVCQTAGCALLVVTHWNKTGDGRGADRISGAGPAAWARVICSVAVHYRTSDPDGASTVLLGCELIGGELADTRFRLRRRIQADDPADLGSPLTYSVEVLAADDDQDLEPAAAALSKSRQWVLTALRAGGDLQTVKQLGDRLAQAGHPLKPRTIQTALGELEAAGLAAGSEEGNGRARYWSPTGPNLDADSAGDGQPGDGGGEGMA